MGPLQESLAKALPSPTASSPTPPTTTPPQQQQQQTSKAKKQRMKQSTKHHEEAATTMQWHDNISSYKCFETIATPSPIPIAKSNQNRSLHRSTSLDSLASSEPNHTDNSSEDSWCIEDNNADDETVDKQSDSLSQCDSITDPKDVDNDLNGQDYGIYEPYFNEPVNINREKPIITELVRKKNDDKLCENRNCAYRHFEQHHSIEDCAPTYSDSNYSVTHRNAATAVGDDNKSKEQTPNVPFILNKTRRTSVVSSGSVSRMETIVEEPIEPKISVKEILARFETLTSLEVQSKASTISSGARAAAQTLNVPIERLEAQVHGAVKSPGSPTVNNNHYEKNHRHHSTVDEIIPSHLEQNGKHTSQPHSYVSQESSHSKSHHSPAQSPQQHSMSPQHGHHKNGMAIENGQLIHSDEQDDQQQFSALSAMQPTPIANAKYTLLQFAMQHFRDDNQAIEDHELNGRAKKRSTSSRPHADLVKWQGTPIRSPLLRLPVELSPLAIECFECILRYCGDLPPDPELTEVKCVYTILMHCHKHLTLRDEVYCQLMKQTTSNRSSNPDSCQRAWRLLSILAAYFSCSDALKPYLMEHLTAAASDRRRTAHGTASVCLSNLRKTARCGGRKNVPSVEEVTAVSAGRSARRQIYRLPGGAERVVNTRGSTVVADVISELCALLGIDSPIEQQEFSLYCIVQGDAFTMPLAADEYILDVTTELLKSGQPFYLIFCRSVWHFPLKRDPMPTLLYVEVLFNQVAPDYLEGLLLELPGGGAPPPDVVRDMARIAVLLHRAADVNHVPAMKEIKFLLPKPALGIRELRPAQWVALVQSAWPSVAGLEPVQVKAQFLAFLAEWPLFGSSFFAVRKVWAEDGLADDSSPIWKEIILALNRRGVLFLDPNTHETLRHWPFMEVISTRKVRSEDGALFLDMKVGNLMQQRVIRVQTEQAHEISRLIRQYITMAQMSRPDRRE